MNKIFFLDISEHILDMWHSVQTQMDGSFQAEELSCKGVFLWNRFRARLALVLGNIWVM